MKKWTEDKLTIGQVAKLHNIPAKTLRYWDNIGLFKPCEIDKNTGYRYYSSQQFYQLSLIKNLKSMGVPYNEIKRDLYQKDASVLLKILRQQMDLTEEKIKELEEINKKYHYICMDIEEALQINELEIIGIKYYPERRIIRTYDKIATRVELEISFRKLEKMLSGNQIVLLPYVCVSISENNLLQRKFNEFNSAFVFADMYDCRGINNITVLPAGEYLSITFWGDFNKTLYYFDLVLDYIDKNNYVICGDALRKNVLPVYKEETKEHLAQILIPVKDISTTIHDRKME